MRRVLSLVAVVAAMSAASGANAWWCTGHMTVATIAKQKMQQSTDGQNALAAVEGLIANFSQTGPFPQIPSMVEAACWADDVKHGLDMATAGWHFYNIPYDPTNYPYKYPGAKETVDVVLRQMETALKGNLVYWEQTFALANLLHFMGDSHQPLHVTELFSADFPEGDLGGNRIDVTINGTSMNLHAVWDSICGYYQNEITRPLDSSSKSLIDGLAQQFVAAHPDITQAEIDVTNTTVYATEGLQYAINYAYDNQQVVQSGITLSNAYINQCYNYATRRIALAGLRMANVLTALFKDGVSKAPSTEKLHARVRDGKRDMAMHARAQQQQAFKIHKVPKKPIRQV